MKATSKTTSVLILKSLGNFRPHGTMSILFFSIVLIVNYSPNYPIRTLITNPTFIIFACIFLALFVITTVTTISMDKTSDTIYIQRKSLIKKTMEKIPLSQVQSVNFVEKIDQSTRRKRYVYDIYLVLKSGSSYLLGPAVSKQPFSQTSISTLEGAGKEIADFIAVPYTISNLEHADFVKMFSSGGLTISTIKNLITKQTSTHVQTGFTNTTNNTLPQNELEQEQLRKIAEQMALNQSEKMGRPLQTSTNSNEPFSSF